MIAEERRRRELERRRRIRDRRLDEISSDSSSLLDYLKGKRVVVVGPAEYLQGRGLGRWIDDHDVVVRMNRSRPLAEDYGSRTDILFNFITELWADYFIDQQPFLEDGLKAIVTTTALPNYYCRFRRKTKIPTFLLTKQEYRAIRNEIGSKPNTGTVAVAYLLTTKIASLDVVGMDLYASGYCKGYGGNLDPGSHDFDTQAIFLDTLQQDKRLTFDAAMKSRIRMAQWFEDDIIEQPLPPISIVIPYGYCDDHRERLMNWTVARYQRLFPECEICVGENGDKPFNRSAAKNDGIRKTSNDLVLIVDNDALFNRSLVHEALNIMATRKQRWVRAGGKSYRISESSTSMLLQTNDHIEMTLETSGLYSTNFFCLVEKTLLDEIGGYDENFRDWGGEDFAFYKTLAIYHREGKRTSGKIWHIWHPINPASEKHMESLKKRDGCVPTARRHLMYANAKTKEDIKRIRETRT